MVDDEAPCSVEETALAIEALLPHCESDPQVRSSVENGLNWLVEGIHEGRMSEAAPIGFYFAKLWYYERLYPHIFAASALELAAGRLSSDEALVGAPL